MLLYVSKRKFPKLKKLVCTVDHLSQRSGAARVTVGAHLICNNLRQHDPEPPPKAKEIVEETLTLVPSTARMPNIDLMRASFELLG
jgi:hypothetical protein